MSGKDEEGVDLYPAIIVTRATSNASDTANEEVTSAGGNGKVRMPVTQLGRVTRGQNRIIELQRPRDTEDDAPSTDDLKNAIKKMTDELAKLKDECQLVVGSNVEQCAAKEEWIRKNIVSKENFLQGVIQGMSTSKAGSQVSSTSSRRAAARQAALQLEQQQLQRRQQREEELERERIQDEIKAREEELRREMSLHAKRREQELQLKLQKERDELECRIMEARFMSEAGSQIDKQERDHGSELIEEFHEQERQQTKNWVEQTKIERSNHSSGMSEATEHLLQQAMLPPTKLTVFEGECTQFSLFIKTFEARVEKVTSDYEHRLQLLLQHLKGEPHLLVRACQLDPDAREAYERAKARLVREYGHPVRQTIAFRSQLMNWPVIRKDAAGDLRKFRIQLELCEEIKSAKMGLAELDAPGTLLQLVKKLPERLQDSWRRKVCGIEESKGREATFEDFVNFVRTQSDAASHPVYGRGERTETMGPSPGKVKSTKVLGTEASARENTDNNAVTCAATAAEAAQKPSRNGTTPPCLLCSGTHKTVECKKETGLTLTEKRERLKGLCFGCLQPGHLARRCRQRATCAICEGRHPTVLHDPAREKAKPKETPQTQVDSEATETAKKTACASKAASPTNAVVPTVPVRLWLDRRNEYVVTTALLDPASTATFATEGLLKRLGVVGQETALEVATMTNPEGEKLETKVVHGLRASDMDRNSELLLPPVYVVPNMPFVKPIQPDVTRWPHLQSVPLLPYHEPVELLIGIDSPAAMRPLETRAGGDNEPYAQRTKLGWYVNGPFPSDKRGANRATVANFVNAQALQQQIDKLHYRDFEDAFNFVDKGLSRDDKTWLELVNGSIQQTVEGQYQIDLPFRSQVSQRSLKNNRAQAAHRLELLARRFRKNPQFQQHYTQFIQKMEDSGYVEEVQESRETATEGVCYIPHHGVYHPRKGKIRVVFNCANRYDGIALNDCLLPGPDLINSLVGVLIRFRQAPVAFMADIESMFYRVLVPEKDRDHLRYLWWPGGEVENGIKTYRLKVHLFGATSSPSVANFALRQAAKDAVKKGVVGREVEEAVNRNFYVDDCLKSMETIEEAVSMAAGLIKACKFGGFRLTKFISTSTQLLHTLPKSELAKELADVDLDDKKDPLGNIHERALGVMWSIRDDTFKFRIVLPPTGSTAATTKRAMLSTLSAVYDPIGLAAPVIIVARILFRNATKSKEVSWDDPLEDSTWTQWKDALTDLEKVAVPRCFRQESVDHWELHVFCDASTDAYAAVAYLRGTRRGKMGNDHVQLAFVMGKARVSPPKVVTIPRLELTAAKLAVDMAALIQRELQYHLNRRIFWTDSQTVLKYLNNSSRRFHTFVANRVCAILNASELQEWRYVPTKMNPADEGTRGREASQLAEGLWLKGPPFLAHAENYWPKEEPKRYEIEERDEEVRVMATSSQPIVEKFADEFAAHYSTWNRLLKAAAIWRRFINFVKSKRKNVVMGVISLQELRDARNSLVSSAQRESWPPEFGRLHKGTGIPRTSVLHQLSPGLKDGLIVMQSRTGRQLPILPKGRLADLLIYDAHCMRLHMGRQATMAEVQQRWWIIGLGQATRQIVRSCPSCQRRHSKPQFTEMAPLPEERLDENSQHPFSVTGVDYFGPFTIQQNETQIKAYGIIFTCANTRAVHLEAALDLSSSSFINALRRFVARRGHVQQFISDNGTNLAGAEAELKKELAEELQRLRRKGGSDRIEQVLRNKGIKWQFNAPGASHRGGFWERLIQTVRRCLDAMATHFTTYEMLYTMLCEVESTLNNRPLTTVSEDAKDLEALTPNHLLLGREGPKPPPGNFRIKPGPIRLQRRWRQTQAVIHAFWKRWTADYKVLLHKRSKWHTRQRREPQVGDVVLVLNPLEARQYWPLGQITAVIRSKDGQVRTCEVRTNGGTYLRPINKLCPLETATQSTTST